jgi:hypothetical protein
VGVVVVVVVPELEVDPELELVATVPWGISSIV